MNNDARGARTVGRYEILRELGRGAMGVVYEGRDPVIGRRIALKTIAFVATDADAQELRKRLYREAAAAGTLTHPNIVTIHDMVDDGNVTAVAMELVEGQPLSAYIGNGRSLPFEQAIQVFDQICAALDYAGARGVVHRDIKPANILLTADGRVKILDFGIARIALGDATQTATIMGSPSYMSPEQVRGQPLDPRSDLFSAAVVLFEMLTGERPFGGDDVATTMYRIVHEPPRFVRELNPAVSPAVARVLERALAKNPADRVQSGSQFMDELRQAWETGEDVPPPVAATMIRPVPTALPPVDDFCPDVVPAVVPPSDVVAETERPRRSPFLIAGLVASAVMLAVVVVVLIVRSPGVTTVSTGAALAGGGAPSPTTTPTSPAPATGQVEAPVDMAPPAAEPERPPRSDATPAGTDRAPGRQGPEPGVPVSTATAAVDQPVAIAGPAKPRTSTGGSQPAPPAPQPAPSGAVAPTSPSTLPPPPALPPVAAGREATVPASPPSSPPAAKPVPSPAASVSPPAGSAVTPAAGKGGTPSARGAPRPADLPPDAAMATLRVTFGDQPYSAALYAGETLVGRVDAADAIISIEPGSTQLRAVNESLYLNASLGTWELKAGERRTVTLPGLASAAFAVRGENYAGVRILVDGRPIPGPYPAQVGRIAAGAHRVVYRWVSGPAAGREVADTVTLAPGGHFVVRASLESDTLAVQQLR